MRICIYGAGAIGGFLGAQLALSGVETTLIARGEHMRAMQSQGVKVLSVGAERVAHLQVTDDPSKAGEQDYIFITLKAPSVPGIVEAIQPMLGPQTAVVWAVNGIPWWYFYKVEGPLENHRLKSVDPAGLLWEKISPERVIGAVVYPAAEVISPGVIKHVEGNRFSLGEPGGERTARVENLSQALNNAGLKAPVRNQIRNEIWVKLWGNLSFNPISALTGATLDQIIDDPGTRSVAASMMAEAREIGERLGVRFGLSIDQRIEGARSVGAHKTSMLQDLERGRTMEIDALVSVVSELGDLVAVETPTIDTVLALVKQRARLAGSYP